MSTRVSVVLPNSCCFDVAKCYLDIKRRHQLLCSRILETQHKYKCPPHIKEVAKWEGLSALIESFCGVFMYAQPYWVPAMMEEFGLAICCSSLFLIELLVRLFFVASGLNVFFSVFSDIHKDGWPLLVL